MSAFDAFHTFNASLSATERDLLKDFVKLQMNELLAARSEDARMRIVRNYLREVRAFLHQGKTKTTTQMG